MSFTLYVQMSRPMLQCSTMHRIGVRELRQNASEWLRRVQRGESFEVTARGRAIAWLVPARDEDILAQLEADGTLSRGEGDLLAIEPLPNEPGKQTLSEILGELRADER
jgi:prevent-host-death family protein